MKTTSALQQLGIHCASTLPLEVPTHTQLPFTSSNGVAESREPELAVSRLCRPSWSRSKTNVSTDSQAIWDCSVPYTTLTCWSVGFLQQLLCLGRQNLGGRVYASKRHPLSQILESWLFPTWSDLAVDQHIMGKLQTGSSAGMWVKIRIYGAADRRWLQFCLNSYLGTNNLTQMKWWDY